MRDGEIVADPERDLLKLVVIERHHASGRVGLGLVKGFGLRKGAIASSVAHDAHNLVIAGASDQDILAGRSRAGGDGRRFCLRRRWRSACQRAVALGWPVSPLPAAELVQQLLRWMPPPPSLAARLNIPV